MSAPEQLNAIKMTIKQKTSSGVVPLYPHTTADIVAVSSLEVEGTEVSNVQAALEALAANNGLVRRVNGKSPAAADDNNNPHVTLKGDITLNANDIYLGANIVDSSNNVIYNMSNTTVGGLLDTYSHLIRDIQAAYVTSVNGQSPTSGAVTIVGTQINNITGNSGVALVDSSTSKINTAVLPDFVLGQMTFGGILYPTAFSGTGDVNITNFVSTLSDNGKAILGFTGTGSYYWTNSTTPLDAISTRINSNAAAHNLYFIIGGTSNNEPFTNKNFNFKIDNTNNNLEVTTGDWIVYIGNKTVEKVDNTDAVSSVNNKIGVVTLNAGDVKLSAAITSGSLTTNTTIQEAIESVSGRVDTLEALPSVSLTTTAGSEKITVGSNELNVATRDTAQTISGAKTFTGAVKIEGNNLTIGKSGASKNIVLYSTGTANKTATIAAPANTDNVTVTLPTATGTVIIGINSGVNSASSQLNGTVAATGVATLADSGIGTSTAYSAVKFNAKGIAIAGAFNLLLLTSEDSANTSYQSVVNNGFYFLADS